ncbi:MAG: hypothetical protein NT177_08650 [Chloroflexi bacterium]|nr:hypothetical protein [Chloroflexota bacterium]
MNTALAVARGIEGIKRRTLTKGSKAAVIEVCIVVGIIILPLLAPALNKSRPG